MSEETKTTIEWTKFDTFMLILDGKLIEVNKFEIDERIVPTKEKDRPYEIKFEVRINTKKQREKD